MNTVVKHNGQNQINTLMAAKKLAVKNNDWLNVGLLNLKIFSIEDRIKKQNLITN